MCVYSGGWEDAPQESMGVIGEWLHFQKANPETEQGWLVSESFILFFLGGRKMLDFEEAKPPINEPFDLRSLRLIHSLFHSFIQEMLTEYLLCPGCCARCWGYSSEQRWSQSSG